MKLAKRSENGFTLIEVMIVVALIAILAAIAVPAFTDQMQRSRRSQAIQGLQSIQLLQEKWRSNNATYGTAAQIGATATSEGGYYAFTVTNPTATGYVATATAQGGQASDTKCATLVLTVNNGAATKSSTGGGTCW